MDWEAASESGGNVLSKLGRCMQCLQSVYRFRFRLGDELGSGWEGRVPRWLLNGGPHRRSSSRGRRIGLQDGKLPGRVNVDIDALILIALTGDW